jgi:intein/homing endonuclease
MKNPTDFNKITEREKGYITGFYVGDGNIFISEIKGVYRLRYFLGLKEVEIQKKIEKILSNFCKNPRIYQGKDNTTVIEIHSKELLNFITRIVDKNGLKKVKADKEFLIGFVEGLIDSDGYVQRNYVEITTMNSKLKNNIVSILRRLGIKSNVRTFTSHISTKTGMRIGFSLNNNFFLPVKWVTFSHTAGCGSA